MADSNFPPFLGVERSVLGRRWRGRLDAAGEAQALALTQAHGLDDFLARVVAGRGVTVADAASYLDPKLRDLMPDPSSLRDMDAAIERLARAIETGEQIAIFGDYDVDGACSSALLVEFWRAAGAPEPLLHIPDRIVEGYGPNAEAIRDLAARGATLLVTVDCGTTSHEAIAIARGLGVDVIVLDHHQAPEVLPDAIIVNPNRQDDLSGQGSALRGRRRFPDARRPVADAARAWMVERRASRARPPRRARPRRAGDGRRRRARSRASTALSSPRVCWSCAAARGLVSRPSWTPPGWMGRCAPIISVSRSGRASTPAVGSATRASAPVS